MISRSLLAGVVLAIAILASGTLSAQSVIEECNCKAVTVRVAPDVRCKVNLVFIYPERPSPLVTVAPGTEVRVPCEVGTLVTLVDCLNHKNPLGRDGCLRNFPADVNCCIDACLVKDKAGCYVIEITASARRCLCQ